MVTYKEFTEVLDLLLDVDELTEWLGSLSEKQRDELYKHKILDEYDLLP